ncbi:MAG: AAA family ATPase, partial [Kiritimatiellia bacterium]
MDERASVGTPFRMKLTRNDPGLFIAETFFSCLARFCRHFSGNFEKTESLFEPAVRQFDLEELRRFVHLCAGDILPDDVSLTDLGSATSIGIAKPASVLAALWTQTGCNELFKDAFANWLEGQAKQMQEWQVERPDPIVARFGELCQFFNLTQQECAALAMAVMAKQFYGGIDHLSGQLGPWGVAVRAAFLGISPEEYIRLLAPKGALRRFGCLKDEGALGADVWLYLIGVDDVPLTGRFFRKIDDPTLPWEFFGELASNHGELLKRMIACTSAQRGVNILLYGEPGTGKSSFARSLARELGRDAFLIAQNNYKDSIPVPASFRFTALRICDRQVPAETSIMIVDEADAMLEGGSGRNPWLPPFGGSPRHEEKGTLNDVLDEIHAPCVWIANSRADWLDLSNRRRFDYSIHFEKLTREQQTTVWRNAAQRHGINDTLPEDLLSRMVGRYAVSAGGIDLALRNLSAMLKEGTAPQTATEATLTMLLDAHVNLLGGPGAGRQQTCAGYSLDGLNIKGPVTPTQIERAVSRFIEARSHKSDADPDSPRMNLLLFGPPGTGKTAFIHYLGQSLGLNVVTKTGSDLLGMYVGETEKNIQEAFREAGREASILFLDEIDGLLRTRADAHQGWEVSKVNEILRQMEEFGGVLACATNFADSLDPAALRRFTFKLEFGCLTEDGKRAFFRRMFAPLDAGELT